jgi:hypothetical protein
MNIEPSGKTAADADAPLSQRLVGTWKLRSRIDLTASGERHPEPTLGDDPVAWLFFDAAGNFAAQFMKRDRSALVSAATGGANNTRAIDGYDAYFGSYCVDPESGLITTTLVGALAREHVGSVLTRAMRVNGDTLTITLDTSSADGQPLTRTLTWSRVA